MLQKRIRYQYNSNNRQVAVECQSNPNWKSTTTAQHQSSTGSTRSTTPSHIPFAVIILFTIIVIAVSFLYLNTSAATTASSSTALTATATATATATSYMHFLSSLLLPIVKRRGTGITSTGITTSTQQHHQSMNNHLSSSSTAATNTMMMNHPVSAVGITTSDTNTDKNTLSIEQQQQQQQRYKVVLQHVIQSALWSFFAGDAIAAPSHWYYGGFTQVQQYYGTPYGITNYVQPSYQLYGSILNKSNLNGGGRSTSSSRSSLKSIIGDVINHGKKDLWDPSKSIHYHATLQKGENTLEASIGRVLLNSIVQNHGRFHTDHFRDAYIQFMTTPNSHNDTYASTCHRMFFANWYYKKLDPKDCPDNDAHNVDTIDGLVLPTITAIAVAGRLDGTIQEAAESAAATVSVTRNSPQLQQYAKVWGAFVYQTIRTVTDEIIAAEEIATAAAAAAANRKDATTRATTTATATTISKIHASVIQNVKEVAQSLRLRTPQIRKSDEITACYLDSAVPAMLDTLIKYIPYTFCDNNDTKQQGTTMSVWDAILKNANIGGENVHRGSCLGAIWGAIAAAATAPVDATNTISSMEHDPMLSSQLVTGLHHHKELSNEIGQFIHSLNDDSRNNNIDSPTQVK